MAAPRFELSVQDHFSAGHHLRGYDGDCARPHGHNWVVRVDVACERLDATGLGMDFKQLKAVVKEVLAPLDHQDLNSLPHFRDRNPSSELVAQFLYRELAKKLAPTGVAVVRVVVDETPSYRVTYTE